MTRWRQIARSLSVYGAFWTRFLHWGAASSPRFLVPVYVFGYCLLFFLACAPPRRAVISNLRLMFPELSIPVLWWRCWRVFWQFSCVQADAAAAQLGQPAFAWEVHGLQHLRALREQPGGVVLITAHMGNYDVAARAFAGRFGRRVNAVRAPERDADTQSYLDGLRRGQQDHEFAVHYNSSDRLLGMELLQLLNAGEVVAIQGDRILFEVSPAVAACGPDGEPGGDLQWALPKGPLVLASMARAPLFPVFITRIGWQSYRIEFEPPFHCETRRGRREDDLQESLREWSWRLFQRVRRDWNQWFVFEPALQKRGREGMKLEGKK